MKHLLFAVLFCLLALSVSPAISAMVCPNFTCRGHCCPVRPAYVCYHWDGTWADKFARFRKGNSFCVDATSNATVLANMRKHCGQLVHC
jgi:hypothetical protein